MADSRALRLHAAAARGALTRGVERRIVEATAPHSRERTEQPDLVVALERVVARSGRGARGRGAVAEEFGYGWFVRSVVLSFLHVRGWGERIDDPETAGRHWSDLIVLVPGLRPDTEHADDGEPGAGTPHASLLRMLAPTDLFTEQGPWRRTEAVLRADGCERVELVGWLHQHFFAERRRETYGNLARRRADVDELGAITQVFTPDWVARTLLENSLGRHSRDAALPYRLPVSGQDADTRRPVDELTVLDPACGTGHLLTHAFDLLHDQHIEHGTDAVLAPARALGALRGLDVDPRVVALAAFCLTVKAWERLGGPTADLPPPRVHVVRSVRFSRDDLRLLTRTSGVGANFWNTFVDADVLGSLIRIDTAALAEAKLDADIPEPLLRRARRVVEQATWLSEQHEVVVANPPYLGTRHMGDRLRALASTRYPVTKGDLCTMFLQRTLELCLPGGYAAVVASESWCVTTRTARVRDLLLSQARLRTAVFVDAAAFGVRLNTVASVFQAGGRSGPVAFTRIGRHDLAAGLPMRLPVPGRDVVEHDIAVFDRVPDRVLAFDLPPALLALYAKGVVLGDVVDLRQGMATTDNARFLRKWWEVPADEIVRDHRRGSAGNPQWVPYNKGGSAVRWWGNQEYVVRWADDARELREVRPASALEDRDFFRGSVSWSNIGRNGVQFRQYPDGFVFDVAGMSAFASDERTQLNLLGWLNSPLVRTAMDVLAPTLNYQVGDVARLPAPELSAATDHARVRELITLTRSLWAQEPTSWEYVAHPLILRSERSWDERARAHVRERTASVATIRRLEQESADHWADVVEALTGVTVGERNPGPLTVRPTLTAQEYLDAAVREREHGPQR